MTRSTPARTAHLEVPTLALMLLHARTVLQAPVGLDVPAPAEPPSARAADPDPALLADWDELWAEALAFRVTQDGAAVPRWFSLEHAGIDTGDAARWAQEQRDHLVQDVIDEASPLAHSRVETARLAGFDRVAVLPLAVAYCRRVDEDTLAVSAITFLDDKAWAQAMASD
ncbi:hypothetical protein Cch01nite_17120 [Cellulomonas chitinilytica]|uniref:Uncharacterized protein n=1 Tax=Cellulomonas chitinilytica TaxID=398759 RepID=A0A919P0D2_9CELL|nr:hypothetical protein [Cellulomonas chitinilytica]GIG20988.1 hypothetical protein Cch01nite_17120 [Cellulomonas chitinilytica]